MHVLTEATEISADSNMLLATTHCRSFFKVQYLFIFTKQLNS